MGNGCCFSSGAPVYGRSDSASSTSTIWHIDSRKIDLSYVDPRLPALAEEGHIELMRFLKESMLQQELGLHAAAVEKTALLVCWTEIEEYKSQEVLGWKKTKAEDIFNKYIDPASGLKIETFSEEQVEGYRQALLELQQEKEGDELQAQWVCFQRIYDEVFLSFQETQAYVDVQKKMKATYNKVHVSHFDYYNVLGKGTSGIVVHASKKSTGKHYALKIIRKKDLLSEFSANLEQVDLEVRVLAAISHPFIVSMDYSFTTEHFGLIVMELVTGGTLRKIPHYFRKGVVPEKHVRFYIAQIAEALHYLHRMGLVYRDLKPANVMVDRDGYIKLADLGGTTDFSTDIQVARSERCSIKISDKSDRAYASSLYASNYGNSAPELLPVQHLDSPVFRRTIIGTPGYMAPEMIRLLFPADSTQPRVAGYTYMADWWSLGVLLYVLMTETLPFDIGESDEADLQLMTTTAVSVDGMSESCGDFLRALLTVDPKERIGRGRKGLFAIQEHPFFAKFDWARVVSKRQTAPVVPRVMSSEFEDLSAMDEPVYHTFADVPCKGEPIPEEMEQYFSNWDYISPATLRIEFGIANEIKQFEEKAKLKKVLGDIGSASSVESSASTAHRGMLTGGFTLRNIFSSSTDANQSPAKP